MLLLLATLAHAGELDLDIQIADDHASLHVGDAAACAEQEIAFDDAGGHWRISALASGTGDGRVWLRVHVERVTPERRFEARPTVLVVDGETARVAVGDSHTLELTATDVEVGRCLPSELQAPAR